MNWWWWEVVVILVLEEVVAVVVEVVSEFSSSTFQGTDVLLSWNEVAFNIHKPVFCYQWDFTTI